MYISIPVIKEPRNTLNQKVYFLKEKSCSKAIMSNVDTVKPTKPTITPFSKAPKINLSSSIFILFNLLKTLKYLQSLFCLFAATASSPFHTLDH